MKHQPKPSFFTFKKSLIGIAVLNLFSLPVYAQVSESVFLDTFNVLENFTVTPTTCEIYKKLTVMYKKTFDVSQQNCINIKPKNNDVSVTILGQNYWNTPDRDEIHTWLYDTRVLRDINNVKTIDPAPDKILANTNKKYSLVIMDAAQENHNLISGYVRNSDGSLSIGINTEKLESNTNILLKAAIRSVSTGASRAANSMPTVTMPSGKKPIFVPNAADTSTTSFTELPETSTMAATGNLSIVKWAKALPPQPIPDIKVGTFKTEDGSPITLSKTVDEDVKNDNLVPGVFYMVGNDLYYKFSSYLGYYSGGGGGVISLNGSNGYNTNPFQVSIKRHVLSHNIYIYGNSCEKYDLGSNRTCIEAANDAGQIIESTTDPVIPSSENSPVSISPKLKTRGGVIPESVLNTLKIEYNEEGKQYLSFVPGDYQSPIYVEYTVSGLDKNLKPMETEIINFEIKNKNPIITNISASNKKSSNDDVVGFNIVDEGNYDGGLFASGITVAVEKAPLNGTIEIIEPPKTPWSVEGGGPSKVIYHPNEGYFGTDTVAIKVTDEWGASTTKEATFTMQDGAEIKGTIASSNSIGIVPFSSNLSIVLTDLSKSVNVSGFNWESSTDNGVTWKNFSKSSSASLYMTTPGAYLVRVGIANKFSGKIFTTPAITVQASVAELPVMKIEGKIDSLNVPSNVLLKLIPNSPVDGATMKGQKYTYEWVLPAGVTGDFKASAGVARFEAGGTHEIIAKMSDAFGNTQNVVYSVDLLARKPIEFTFEAKKTIPVARNPMAYFLRPTIRLWHSKDKITEYKLSVDSQVIGKPSSRFLGYVSGLNAGVHNIKLEYKTLLGEEGSSELDVTVAQNQVPTCELSNRLIEKTKMMLVAAKCKDVDGKIKSIMWNVDGVDLPRSTAGISVDMSSRSSATVNVKVTDDSGDVGTGSISF